MSHTYLLPVALAFTSCTTPSLNGPLTELTAPAVGDAILSTSPGGRVRIGEQTFAIQAFDFESNDGKFSLLPIFDDEEGFLVLGFDGEGPTGDAMLVRHGREIHLEDLDLMELETEESIGLVGSFTDPGGQNVPVAAVVNAGAGCSTLRLEGQQAFLSGELGSGTYHQIEYLIEAHPDVRTLVFEEVPGSMNDEINVETGRLIRRAGLTTRLPADGVIASGGVDLFCAGAKRIIEGGRIGVHSWGDPGNDVVAADLPRDHPAHSSQIAYFREMLPRGEDFYFYTLNASSFDSVHWMEPEEIASWGLAIH